MEICTWNVFHGNTKPPQRHAFVREAVEEAARLADVVCLQELPAWALSRLGGWTEYTPLPALAARPSLGPLPSTAELGRVLTSLNAGLLRSAFSGQGNAILLAPRFRVVEHRVLELNARSFRRRLDVGLVARLAWAKERRVCQAARIDDGARTLLVSNLHATSYKPDERLADAELLRAFAWVDGLARAGEPVVVAGDFNVTAERSRTLTEVTSREWGFSGPGPGIDQILVRGLKASPPRRVEHTISDHAPVVVEVA